MKTRLGFVSNSSSSSFTCEKCGFYVEDTDDSDAKRSMELHDHWCVQESALEELLEKINRLAKTQEQIQNVIAKRTPPNLFTVAQEEMLDSLFQSGRIKSREEFVRDAVERAFEFEIKKIQKEQLEEKLKKRNEDIKRRKK